MPKLLFLVSVAAEDVSDEAMPASDVDASSARAGQGAKAMASVMAQAIPFMGAISYGPPEQELPRMLRTEAADSGPNIYVIGVQLSWMKLHIAFCI